MTSLIDGIPADWRAALAEGVADPSFQRLDDLMATERVRTDTGIYPPAPDVFAALRLTPLDSVRAVILGQDPYHGEGQAHGLAFSVQPDKPLPPSLRNVLAEWEADQELGPAPNGSLVPWARQGVLLLNAVMTVRQGTADSHRDQGWEPFTDAIVRAVSDKKEPVAFLLWGRPAQRKLLLIDGRHVVIQSAHPAARGPKRFRGSKPFSAANAALQALGRPAIDWSLTDSN